MELYGFSVELPVQKQFGPVLAKCCCQYTRNAYCWSPLVKHFQKNEFLNPVQLLVLRPSYLAVGKTANT